MGSTTVLAPERAGLSASVLVLRGATAWGGDDTSRHMVLAIFTQRPAGGPGTAAARALHRGWRLRSGAGLGVAGNIVSGASLQPSVAWTAPSTGPVREEPRGS